jgi:hypothetical protein
MRAKKFWLPDGRPFEIPFEWWTEAGMDGFSVGADKAYRGKPIPKSRIVLIADIDLPSMEHRRLSNGPLDRDTMISVLWSIAERAELLPVTITRKAAGHCRYRLHDGAHRYHASVAAGLTHIPALIVVR